jgi:catechol 2,3-dioxygenase-like lactoylglutathione lyase family enzyme
LKEVVLEDATMDESTKQKPGHLVDPVVWRAFAERFTQLWLREIEARESAVALMTELDGIHHLGLTVLDAERSARWYEEVLGFCEVGRFGDARDERRKIFLRHEGLAIRLGLVSHRDGSRHRFDETTTGLDHLSFAVADRPTLERWCLRFEELGVEHTRVANANSIPGALVVVFRDPDNIQLELFVEDAQPRRSARATMIHDASTRPIDLRARSTRRRASAPARDALASRSVRRP